MMALSTANEQLACAESSPPLAASKAAIEKVLMIELLMHDDQGYGQAGAVRPNAMAARSRLRHYPQFDCAERAEVDLHGVAGFADHGFDERSGDDAVIGLQAFAEAGQQVGDQDHERAQILRDQGRLGLAYRFAVAKGARPVRLHFF